MGWLPGRDSQAHGPADLRAEGEGLGILGDTDEAAEELHVPPMGKASVRVALILDKGSFGKAARQLIFCEGPCLRRL
jgi:hypothetical protein